MLILELRSIRLGVLGLFTWLFMDVVKCIIASSSAAIKYTIRYKYEVYILLQTMKRNASSVGTWHFLSNMYHRIIHMFKLDWSPKKHHDHHDALGWRSGILIYCRLQYFISYSCIVAKLPCANNSPRLCSCFCLARPWQKILLQKSPSHSTSASETKFMTVQTLT